MHGTWSWAEHIQIIYSHIPVLRCTKLLEQPKINFKHMKFWWMKIECLQDEGVGCSSHRMRAFVCDFEGSNRVPYVPNG